MERLRHPRRRRASVKLLESLDKRQRWDGAVLLVEEDGLRLVPGADDTYDLGVLGWMLTQVPLYDEPDV